MACEIIIAYANSAEQPLSGLKPEVEKIYEYLNRIDPRERRINPVLLGEVTKDTLFRECTSRRAIKTFHFSGHAGGLELLFGREKPVYSRAIAGMLGVEARPRLVFLNGCGTKDMVDEFHEQGIKIVIATSREVQDQAAAGFAIRFYAAFSQMLSVKKAFDMAKAWIEADARQNKFGDSDGRYDSTTVMQHKTAYDCPWGLYFSEGLTQDQKKDLEEWSMAGEMGIDEEDIRNAYQPCVQLLSAIGQRASEAIQYFTENPTDVQQDQIGEFEKLSAAYSRFSTRPQTVESAEPLIKQVTAMLPKTISDVFLQMIACSKRCVETPSTVSYRALLVNQLKFYDVTLQFAYYTMLSNFFEILISFESAPDRKRKFKALLENGDNRLIQKIKDVTDSLTCKENTNRIRYAQMIRDMADIIIATEETPFISEYSKPRDEELLRTLNQAHDIIEQKKEIDINDIRGAIVPQCKMVEDQLAIIFGHVYYILRYKLLVIRNIEAWRFRHKKSRSYYHHFFVSEGDGQFRAIEREILDTDGFTESYSVILVKGISRIVDYLSLSPFVIDKGAITNADKSDMYILDYCEEGQDVYKRVKNADDNIKIKVEMETVYVEENNVVRRVSKKIIPYARDLHKTLPQLDVEKVTMRLLIVKDQLDYFRNLLNELGSQIKPTQNVLSPA